MSLAPDAAPASQGTLASAPPARFSRSLALRAAGVLVASAAAAIAATTLLSSSPGPAARAPGAPHAALPELRAVTAAQAASFAILRRPRTTADAFAQITPGAGPLGANPDLARAVAEPAGRFSRGSVSVVPANGAICLRVPGPSETAQWWCQPMAAALRGRLLMALRPPGPLRPSNQLLVGLAPDGVRSVTVAAAGGVRRTVAVHENVYDTQIFAPTTVTLTLPSGAVVRSPAP